MNKVFITGTDTDIGKTFSSLFLLNALQNIDSRVGLSYYKPIQTGSIAETDSQFIKKNNDNLTVEKETYLYPQPISPNRAAELEHEHIEIHHISKRIASISSDFTVIEGAGGLEVPINKTQRISDIVNECQLPVLIIASTKLGTINHTILTIEVAKAKNLNILGIVLSGDKDKGLKDIIEDQTGVSVVGEIPYINESEIKDHLSRAHEFFKINFLESLIENRSNDQRIWYPFTQHKLRNHNYEVIRGKGSYLYLKNGTKIFDAISSWWVNIHGHANLEIANAISDQAKELEHTILAGLNHAPVKNLSQELIELTTKAGASFSKAFFSDNGSTSVEVALKMAYQYHDNLGAPRKKFLSLHHSYHGDTIGAMSVSSRNGFHKKFDNLLFDVEFLTPDDLDELNQLKKNNPEQYVAFIVEPLVQGAGGMRFYSPEYLKEIRKFCSEHNIILIFDEVFTGFGRLENNFAFERVRVIPDILCLSKGISGGFLPLSATLATNKIYQSFLSDRIEDAFLHGHSYTGNPISCAASLASIKILKSAQSIESRKMISAVTAKRIEKLRDLEVIHNSRSLGTIGAFEIDNDENYFSSDFSYRFFERSIKRGVLLRPLGKTIYTVPPFSSTENDINNVYDIIEDLIHEHIR